MMFMLKSDPQELGNNISYQSLFTSTGDYEGSGVTAKFSPSKTVLSLAMKI